MKCLICKKSISEKYRKLLLTPGEKLFSQVKVSHKCWRWTGVKDRAGYGRISMHRGHVDKAHRVSFAVCVRRIKKGEQILHKCDTPSCIRPSHLFPGNHLKNMRDMFAKGRRIAAVGRKNGKAKLSVEQVRQIRKMYANAAGSSRAIAVALSLKPSTVQGVLSGRQWAWLKVPKKIQEKIGSRKSGNNAWSFR